MSHVNLHLGKIFLAIAIAITSIFTAIQSSHALTCADLVESLGKDLPKFKVVSILDPDALPADKDVNAAIEEANQQTVGLVELGNQVVGDLTKAQIHREKARSKAHKEENLNLKEELQQTREEYLNFLNEGYEVLRKLGLADNEIARVLAARKKAYYERRNARQNQSPSNSGSAGSPSIAGFLGRPGEHASSVPSETPRHRVGFLSGNEANTPPASSPDSQPRRRPGFLSSPEPVQEQPSNSGQTGIGFLNSSGGESTNSQSPGFLPQDSNAEVPLHIVIDFEHGGFFLLPTTVPWTPPGIGFLKPHSSVE